jgi:hypothetical protein
MILFSLSSQSFGNEEILNHYLDQLKSTSDKGKTFSQAEGEKFFRFERLHSNGEKVSCMTCHTGNPKASGQTRANKLIDPIAPVANKDRFTDLQKVEKWFKRNCKDVYERECTVLEKGNFIKYMMSVK